MTDEIAIGRNLRIRLTLKYIFLAAGAIALHFLVACTGAGSSSTGTSGTVTTTTTLSPNVSWQGTKRFGAAGYNTGIISAKIDSSGSFYILAGSYSGAYYYQARPSGVNFGIYLKSFNRAGEVISSTTLGDWVTDFAYESTGNLYVLGLELLTGVNNFSLKKYSSDGTLQWNRYFSASVGTSLDTSGVSLVVDASENIYFLGTSGKGSVDPAITPSFGNAFLAKYDTLGNKLWAKQISATNIGTRAIKVILNSSQEPIVLTTIEAVNASGSTTGPRFGQVHRYDSSGNLLASASFNDETGVGILAYDLATDSSKNIYVVGTYEMAVLGRPGSGFLWKIKPDLTREWSKFVAPYTQTTDNTKHAAVNAVVVDDSDKIYITGYSNGSFDSTAKATTNSDAYLSKFDSNGNLVFTSFFGDTSKLAGLLLLKNARSEILMVGGATAPLDGTSKIGPFDCFISNFTLNGVKQ